MDTVASHHTAAPIPVATSTSIERPATGMLAILAATSFGAHMLVAGNYGYFRDELYYIADGRHLQAGYVDQPLLMGWLAALMRVIAADNLVAIHVIPALACSLIVVITGLMAREFGGGRMAQLTAGVAALFTLDFMATGSLFSMDVLDQVWWALVSLLLIRLLGWIFVFLYVILTALRVKAYFLAPAYPIAFASGAVALERLQLRPRLVWLRPSYVAVLALAGILLAPAVMPILPPASTVRVYGPLGQVLADRLGWVSLTHTVEHVYAALPSSERAHACILASNYGEAGALQQLAPPGRLPPVISGHNNYYLWGPGGSTGQVVILVGYSPSDLKGVHSLYARVTLAAVHRCEYCVAYEQTLPIYVLSAATRPIFPGLWPSLKSFS